MRSNPYTNLPASAYWKTAVAECDPAQLAGIYTKKFDIQADDIIATAGSCFAQRISHHLRRENYCVADYEPLPKHIPQQQAEEHGYGLYSARYGNVYTVHQLLQLATEALDRKTPEAAIWQKDDQFFDALRPSIEPKGFATADELIRQRQEHITQVRKLFAEMDVFIFTLGLTETWRHRQHGTIYPIAPGVIAGEYVPSEHEFINFSAQEIKHAFLEFLTIIRSLRDPQKPEVRVILTVSPVPLTATASNQHILQATCYSKSTLRVVTEELRNESALIDYFPSYEIITNQTACGNFYESNFRGIKTAGVDAVMKVFFEQHQYAATTPTALTDTSTTRADSAKPELNTEPDHCDETLLEEFVPATQHKQSAEKTVLFLGDSHLAAVKKACNDLSLFAPDSTDAWFVPSIWLNVPWSEFQNNNYLRDIVIRSEFVGNCQTPPSDIDHSQLILILTGMSVLGDGIIRAFGAMQAGRDDVTDGRTITPTLPLFENQQSNHVRKRFEKFYAHHFSKLSALRAANIYQNIILIESPDMTERCARFRLGEEFVESGSYHHYRKIAREVVYGYAKQANITLIGHPPDLRNEFGFSQDSYASTDKLFDIHVNSEYYTSALNELKKVIEHGPESTNIPSGKLINFERKSPLRNLTKFSRTLRNSLRRVDK